MKIFLLLGDHPISRVSSRMSTASHRSPASHRSLPLSGFLGEQNSQKRRCARIALPQTWLLFFPPVLMLLSILEIQEYRFFSVVIPEIRVVFVSRPSSRENSLSSSLSNQFPKGDIISNYRRFIPRYFPFVTIPEEFALF